MSTGDDYLKTANINSVLNFGAEIMRVLGSSAFAVVGECKPGQRSKAQGAWLNQRHAREVGTLKVSPSFMNAHVKFSELFVGYEAPPTDRENGTEKTPRDFTDRGRLWSGNMKGGARSGERAVAVSGQAAEHDLLIAGTMLWYWYWGFLGPVESYTPPVPGEARMFKVKPHDPYKFLFFVSNLCDSKTQNGPDGIRAVFVETTDVRGLGPRLAVAV